MSRYYDDWAPYVPVAERRRQAERAVAKLRKTGRPVAPVAIAGRHIATTFWGRAWCDNMESYRDYESRLPRGRTYVRNGSVVDLQIAPGRITALVSGSDLYDVAITVKETVKAQWRSICADCAASIDSLVELLQGRFSKGVMERLCRQEGGLFPRPADIRFSCSCQDHASTRASTIGRSCCFACARWTRPTWWLGSMQPCRYRRLRPPPARCSRRTTFRRCSVSTSGRRSHRPLPRLRSLPR
jgi:hypothetical protein